MIPHKNDLHKLNITQYGDDIFAIAYYGEMHQTNYIIFFIEEEQFTLTDFIQLLAKQEYDKIITLEKLELFKITGLKYHNNIKDVLVNISLDIENNNANEMFMCIQEGYYINDNCLP